MPPTAPRSPSTPAPEPRRRVRAVVVLSIPNLLARRAQSPKRVERASRLLRESVEPWHQRGAVSVQHEQRAVTERSAVKTSWTILQVELSKALVVYRQPTDTSVACKGSYEALAHEMAHGVPQSWQRWCPCRRYTSPFLGRFDGGLFTVAVRWHIRRSFGQ